MKRTKIYLNQKQQKSPTPLTPVDVAWDKMTELLDSEMPEITQESKKRVFAISFSQFAISLVAAIIFVGGGTFITLKTIEDKQGIYTPKHAIKHLEFDSLINKTVQSEDSAIAEIDIQTSINTNQKADEEVIHTQQQNNNQTSLSATIKQTNTPQRVVLTKKNKLKRINVYNAVLNPTNSNSITNRIEKHHEMAFIDSIGTQNNQPNSILPKDEDLAKVELETKPSINDSLRIEINSLNTNLSTKEKEKTQNGGNINPKTNHLFIGLTGYNGLLFSKNTSKNIYSYGETLTIGVRNSKYNLTVETGIGYQSLEYHVPYSRTLYTYQVTGVYDSTTTVSSYKYSRHNIIIPFFITKEIFRYNNIFLDVKTGINTSVFLSQQRLFNQLPVDIQLIEDLYPISNINFSFALSPQIRWEINRKLSFNINAGGLFYLNSLYQNYTLKPIGLNLSAGINYTF